MDSKEFYEMMNVETWFGFDENSPEPMCHTVKFYKLKPDQCDISKQAFGLGNDAIYIEKASLRIFAYSTEQQCIDALEVRNSNAP